MHRGFTKLFNTIVTSTIWQEDDKTRIVWITMLAIADPDGIVSAALPGLASVANVSLEAAEKAVNNLESPDQYSRTKDFDGRRIEEVDGGWIILNYMKYRRMLNEEERKEYKAKWIAQKRRQMSTKSTSVDGVGQMSTTSSASSSLSESEWIKELCTDKAYEGIDVRREHSKAIRWAKENRVQMTRRRFVNWLNRADKQMKLGARTDEPVKSDPSKIEVPERFKSWVAERYPDKREDAMKWRTWADVPRNGLRDEWWKEEKNRLPVEL